MDTHNTKGSLEPWSMAIVILVIVTSLCGLLDPNIYSKEVLNWTEQAKGQDIGNLIAAAALTVSMFWIRKDRLKASLLWVGSLLYVLYAYIIYAFAVHFNALFLVYVTILGLSAYAILLNINKLRGQPAVFPQGDARKYAAYTLISIGVLFGLLWLKEIIPALVTGKVPQSIQDAGLGVNPVHVIDLAIVLPAFILTGNLALKGKINGLFFVTPWLVFSVLMGLSIVAGMVLMTLHGFSNTLPPMVMVSLVVCASFIALWKYAAKIR